MRPNNNNSGLGLYSEFLSNALNALSVLVGKEEDLKVAFESR